MGGPLALIEDGDVISIDANKNEINLMVDDKTLLQREKKWQAPKNQNVGVLAKYSKMVSSASKGAFTS